MDKGMKIKKNIVLCGFMGSGKTTVGALLARTLGVPFVDLDERIAEETGLSVSDWFLQRGEAAFRAAEAALCRTLSEPGGQVIAPGGGALLREPNVVNLKKNGEILFLDTSLSVIRRRLAADKSRPLLNRPDREREMERLYYARKPQYERISDGIIPADDAPEAVAERILDWLRERGIHAGE